MGDAEPGHGRAKHLLLIGIGVVVVNGAVALALPDVRAVDSYLFEQVGVLLRAHRNPYTESDILNYPPFIMQIVAGLAWSAEVLDVSFNTALRVFNGACEMAVAMGLYLVLTRLRSTSALKLVLLGVVFNPAVIAVQTLHGNFDMLVALALVGFFAAGFAWLEQRDPISWLLMCTFVGFGVLTKLFPIVLVPVLAIGFVASTPAVRALGAGLVFGPVALATSVILAIDPDSIIPNVLHYNSTPGYFGITGILDAVGLDGASSAYVRAFRTLLLVLLGVATVGLARRGIADRAALVRPSLVLMAFVPVFGPGYGPQYLILFMPALVLLFAVGGPLERRLTVAVWAIAAVTLLVEYAVIPTHGAFLLTWVEQSTIEPWSERFASRAGATALRVPLFLTLTALMGVAAAPAADRQMS